MSADANAVNGGPIEQLSGVVQCPVALGDEAVELANARKEHYLICQALIKFHACISEDVRKCLPYAFGIPYNLLPKHKWQISGCGGQ